jgi:hypothetical protein
MNNNCSKKFRGDRAAHSITLGLLAAFTVLAASGIAFLNRQRRSTGSHLFCECRERAKPGSLRQRDLAQFLRRQQGVGGCKSTDNDPGRLRPKLPECWLDRLPVTAVHRVTTKAHGGKILTRTTFIQRLNTGGSASIPRARSPAMWGIKRSSPRTVCCIDMPKENGPSKRSWGTL